MVRWWPTFAFVCLVIISLSSQVSSSPFPIDKPVLRQRRADKKHSIPSASPHIASQATEKIKVIKAATTPSLISNTTASLYQSHVQFAADAYCSGLIAGDHVGTDGIVLWETGNGRNVQMVYVAYSPTLGIVVGHQGTNTSSYASIENDLDFNLVNPLPTLAWLGKGVQISTGFQQAWNDTADQILIYVKQARLKYPKARVVTTGHSLGAATALLGALQLTHALNVSVSSVLFGLPRTGNPAFANAVDLYLPNQNHITHFHDPVPHAPSRTFGYRHPSGEVWIATEVGSIVYACSGQEDLRCADSVSIFQYQIADHTGPYFGVTMQCRAVP